MARDQTAGKHAGNSFVYSCWGGVTALYLFLYRFYIGNDLHYAGISCAWGFLSCTICSLYVIFFVSRLIAKVIVISNVFQYFGRNSLMIMTTHLEYNVVTLAEIITVQLGVGALLQQILPFVFLCLLEVLICEAIHHTGLKYVFYPKRKIGK